MRAALEAVAAWPQGLLGSEALADDLRLLDAACDRSGVSDAALAAAAADADEHVSLVARTLLAARANDCSGRPKVGAELRSAATFQRDANLVTCGSVAEALEALRQRGIGACAAAREFVEAVAGVELDVAFVAAGCDEGGRSEAVLEFKDGDRAPISREELAAVLGLRPGELLSALQPHALVVRITQPLSRALGEWLAGLAGAARDAWIWPEPEAPQATVAPLAAFSASRLNMYAGCPRRWFFEYLCAVLEDKPTVAVAYGRVFHEALESLHRVVRRPSEHSAAQIRERLLGELDAAFRRARADFASPLEYEVSRLKARGVAQQYVRWLCREAAARAFEVRDVEVAQKLSTGGHTFVGYIDRIDVPVGGGPVTIFDYKTGRIDTDPDAYLDRIRTGSEAQLALYHAMRRAAGDDVERVALVSVRDPRDEVWLLALDVVPDAEAAKPPVSSQGVLGVSCSAADLEQAIGALVDRCDLLTREGLRHFPAGADPPCSFCAYARACRERPAEKERIFAR